MPQVIRYGQKPKANTGGNKWSDAEILRAYWDMEEEKTGRPSPMRRAIQRLDIPELNPVPLTEEKRGSQNE